MKKTILIICFIILMAISFSSVMALDECEPVVETFDLPCRITTTWTSPNPCNTYDLKMFKDDTLLDTRTLGTFGTYCNATFNYTEQGSYYYNITNGDTGGILIKEEMQQIYNLWVYGGYLLAVFVLIIFMHKFKEDTGTPIVYGTMAGVLSFIMVAMLLSGFEVFLNMVFIVDINYYLIALTTGIGLYTSVIAWTFYTDLRDIEQPA